MRDAQDPDVLTGRRAERPGLRWSLPVAAAVLVADQLTKWWAVENLTSICGGADTNCVSLPGGITLRLAFNTGAAFSRGEGLGPVLGIVAVAMTLVLLEVSRRRPDRLTTALMGAIAGGALGNVADRLFRAEDGFLSGAVVDFVDLGWWPVFNVADSAIVVGVLSVIVLSLFEPVDQPPEPTVARDDEAADEVAADRPDGADGEGPVGDGGEPAERNVDDDPGTRTDGEPVEPVSE